MCVCTPPKFKANLKAFLRKRRHPQARGFNFLEIHFNRWIFGGGYHIYIYIYIYICSYVYVYIYTCAYIHMGLGFRGVYVHTYIYIYTHVHIAIQKETYLGTSVFNNINIHPFR